MTVRGNGLGGRNQEMVLYAALRLDGTDGMLFASVGSDGTDGPTDAAGGIADGTTASAIRNAGVSPEISLENNDSYRALKVGDALAVTGPQTARTGKISSRRTRQYHKSPPNTITFPQALALTNTLIDFTRTTSGSTEVVTGEVLGANMAASAIIALQNQAKKPIEMYQKKFYRCYVDKAKIYEQFFKYYYNDNRLFGYEEDNVRYAASMNGNDFLDFNFNVSVEVGAGGVWSESLSITLLDNLKADGTINQDDYIELYPESIMTFKQKLKKIRQKHKEEAELLTQNLLNENNNSANANILPNQ